MCDISMNSARFFLSFLLLSAIACTGVSLAEGDPYLQELEAEVGANSVDGANESQLSDQKNVVGNQQSKRKEFEKKLLDDRPTTFKAYLKLPEEEKAKVIEAFFSADKNIEKASRLVFDLYYK